MFLPSIRYRSPAPRKEKREERISWKVRFPYRDGSDRPGLSNYQAIGRVRTGWSRRAEQELLARLKSCPCPTPPTAGRRFVRPELVVEIRSNDLIAANSADEPIRRMRFDYGTEAGWSPLGPAPSASMLNPVFVRIRNDKQGRRPDVRFEQVSDLVPAAPENSAPVVLPLSRLLRREALRRPGRSDQVVWMGLPDLRGRKDIFGHFLRGLKLDPQLAPDRLAAELAAATDGMTGADIAYLCQRAAMSCVKEAAAGSADTDDIAVARRHFDASLSLLATTRAAEAAPQLAPLLLAS